MARGGIGSEGRGAAAPGGAALLRDGAVVWRAAHHGHPLHRAVAVREGYQPVIVVFDTHTRNKQRIADLLQEIQLPLIRAGISERVLLVPAVPSVASWVLSDDKALERVAGAHLPEGASRARGRSEALLRKLLGAWSDREQKRVARYLDPERIRSRDKSFAAFVRALEMALGARASRSSEEQEPAVT